jgi:hypothetical protein
MTEARRCSLPGQTSPWTPDPNAGREYVALLWMREPLQLREPSLGPAPMVERGAALLDGSVAAEPVASKDMKWLTRFVGASVWSRSAMDTKDNYEDRYMKSGQDALAQYSELADAIRQVGASWIIAEVEEVIARGKTVPFRDLSVEQSALYESRLSEEARGGVFVGRAKSDDSIGVPYEPHERLALLVEALERTISTSEKSYSYVSRFAIRLGIYSVRMENPVGAYNPTNVPETWNISMTTPVLMNERLAILHHVLHDEVLG